MVHFGSIVHFVASAKAAVTRRDAVSPRENLGIINDALQTLAATLAAYSGGLLGAAPMGRDSAALCQTMKNAIKDAKAIHNPTEAEVETEAREIIAYIHAELLPSTQAIIKAAKEKKDLFAAANLQGLVMEEMKMMKDLLASLSQVLFEKAPKHLMEEGRALNDRVDAELAGVMEYYS